MSATDLVIANRQRGWRVDTAVLRDIVHTLLNRELGLETWQLGLHLVGARVMASLNWRWLRHEGSTDVITFDHRESQQAPLHGEIFISLDDAATQAAEFGTSQPEELVRYVVHGVLHLRGYDDLQPEARRVMKRAENRLLKRLLARHRVGGLVRCRSRRD
ncbi:MAG: rRNA maturation RNase YbeY [Verrucomicrobiales bacterium]|nr:rRNA maturation RNase YbeY [Verrucomicrobiales bacterium]